MAKAVILIIEDDSDIQEILAFAFSLEGWKLLMEKIGEEGLSLLKSAMDLRIPVILATAKGEKSDIVTGLELGADDYVVKPYSPKILDCPGSGRLCGGFRKSESRSSIMQQYNALVQQGTLKADLAWHEVYDGAR